MPVARRRKKTPTRRKKTPIRRKKTPIRRKKTPIRRKRTPIRSRSKTPSQSDWAKGVVGLYTIPGIARPRYRWVVKRSDGRLVGRAAKIGVRIGDLQSKRPKDFGKPALLPKGTRCWRR